MKKKYTYFLILFSFFAFTVLILKYRKSDVKYELELRQGALASTSEWLNSKSAIEGLIERLRNNPSDNKIKLSLGMAYIQEARISGNHAYYDKAALELFNSILNKEENNFEALIGKATVLLSQHHFSDAIPVAEQAMKISEHTSSVFGLLTDAYVELGDYQKAIEMADKMSATRPDMRSYSRISYLREILGDYIGAIDAMKMAVEAGYPGSEQTEWCRVQLGHLYENTGNLVMAQHCYDQSIYFRPTFSWAFAGLARVEKAKGNNQNAIQLLKTAQAILPDFTFQQELTEIYRISNQPYEAAVSARKTIEILGGVQGDDSGKNHGHYADKELSYAYLDAYDYINAYKHALIEYNRRPENIEVNQLLAWVNYKLGRYEEANRLIDIALRTGSKNTVLNYEAGLIKSKFGLVQEGSRLMNQSLAMNPYISPSLKWETKKMITMR